MDGVNRISRKGATTNHASSVDHRRLQKSSTLNRRFVRRPSAAAKTQSTAKVQQKVTQTQQKKTVASARVSAQQTSAKTAQQQLSSNRQQGQQQKAVVRSVAGTRGASGKQSLIQHSKAGKIQPSAAFIEQQKRLRQKQQQNAAQQQVGKRITAQQLAKIRQQAATDLKQTRKQESKDIGPQGHKLLDATRARMAAQAAPAPAKITAQERKDRAIQQALQRMQSAENTKEDFGEKKIKKQHFWQKKRFAVAMAMAIISIGLLGYLVSLNLPDISVRVAAMQAGISNAYPSYVPSNYRLDGLVKEENGKITMNFKNDIGKTFSLIEEKSSWDSTAVLANYVKKNWGDDYSIAKGQGLTIYISGSKAVWVNGGVLYIVDGEAAELNSSDLHDIAVSL